MRRGFTLSGVVAIAIATTGPAPATAAPPPRALTGADASGRQVAVWLDPSNRIVTERSDRRGRWLDTRVVYTPLSHTCAVPRGHCITDDLGLGPLVVAPSGRAAYAVHETVSGICEVLRFGELSTAGRVTPLEGGPPVPCRGHRGDRSHLLELHVAIAPDGTSAFAAAWVDAYSTWVDFGETAWSAAPSSRRLGSGPESQDDRHPQGLAVAIDRRDVGTAVWRQLQVSHGTRHRPATNEQSSIQAFDFELGSTTHGGTVSPRHPTGPLVSFTVAPDGAQSIVYPGLARGAHRWTRGLVRQQRAGTLQPWSAPVLLP